MSDRIAVFNDGRIEQIGSPDEIYERPVNPFVAGFVGTSNVIERDGESFTVRPEKVRLVDCDAAEGLHTERGTVADVAYAGPMTRFTSNLRRAGGYRSFARTSTRPRGTTWRGKVRRSRSGGCPEHTVAIEAANGSDPGDGPLGESPNQEEEPMRAKHKASRTACVDHRRVHARVRIRIRMRQRRRRLERSAEDAQTELGEGEGEVNLVAWAGYVEDGSTDPGRRLGDRLREGDRLRGQRQDRQHVGRDGPADADRRVRRRLCLRRRIRRVCIEGGDVVARQHGPDPELRGRVSRA